MWKDWRITRRITKKKKTFVKYYINEVRYKLKNIILLLMIDELIIFYENKKKS